jgi:hypothetical protein
MRKGQSSIAGKWIYFILALPMIAIMFLALNGSFVTYQAQSSQCLDQSVNSLMLGKVISSTCFTYTDPQTGRDIVGSIDINKLTQKNFDGCFKYIEQEAQITIGEITIGDEIESPQTLEKSIFVYEDGIRREELLYLSNEEIIC